MIERMMGEPVENVLEDTRTGEPEQNLAENAPEEISCGKKPSPPPVSRLVKVDNWGSFFLQQLHSLYLNKEDCDFTLQFHDGHKLEVHRNVLNACTEFFKSLNIEGSNVLLPVEFSFEAFNAIINFMYTGRLEYADQICENMYAIAKVLKMTVLVKLLEAQFQNQENSGVPTPISAEKGKASPLLLTKATKVMKRLSTNGKKSIKLLSSSSPTLPGKKLPIWKKRTVPLPATSTSFFSANGIIKRNILDPARPVRFEWPDDSVEFTTVKDEFEDLSYHSEPLVKPNRGELQYLSAEDFDVKVNSVLKRSFTGCQDDVPEKRSRIDSSMDRIYSSVDINSIDCDSSYSNSQIITSLDDDNDSSDNDNDNDNDNDLSEESSLLNKSSNGCDLNVTPYDSKPVTPAVSTPKPILKTSGTPSSLKKVRFSLEEKENAQSLEDQTVSVVESVKSGIIQQTTDFLNNKSAIAGSVTMMEKLAMKPASAKSLLFENDAAQMKRTVGAKLPVNKNAVNDDKLISTSRDNITTTNEAKMEQKIDDAATNGKLVFDAEKDVSETEKKENSVLKAPATEKTFDFLKPAATVISDKKQVIAKPVVPGVKTTVPNHARIVAEVLKKYPHLVNKNVRLKIMNPDGNKNSVTSIKINCPTPTNQSGAKTSKNTQIAVGVAGKNDSAEVSKIGSTKDPCKGPWLCSSCGSNGKPKNFESYYLYHKHLQEIHHEKVDSRICEHCGQKFSKRNLLSYHLYKKHNIPPPRNLTFPKCDQCDYIALSESLLIKHRNSNAHQAEFECKVCSAKFKSNGALQGHMQAKLHFSEPSKMYKCPHCSQEFPRNINLKAHIRNAHPKQRKVEEVSNNDEMYSNNVLLEQQNSGANEGCTLILPSGVALVADTQQVPLLPSSESEALNNVASGIATSIGLNDSLVNGETVILLNEGTEYFLQNTSNQGEYIVPEILSSSDQMYTFQPKDQLEQVTTIANLCSGVPTSVSQLISEDTIVTIDDSTNNYSTEYNVPISIAEKLHNRDNNQLILFTLSGSEPPQKLPNQNAQSIIVSQASGSLSDRPAYLSETCLPPKLTDANFEENINFGVPTSHFRDENIESIESVEEQNCRLSQCQLENVSNGGNQTEISNEGIHADHCDASSSVVDNSDESVSVTNSASIQDQNVDVLQEPMKDLVSNIKVDSSQMEELVQDWDEFSDEERQVENEDDGKLSNLPCRPTFGPPETESFLL